MGISVANQCDTKNYFSLSNINKTSMALHGLTCSIRELQRRARITTPHLEIYTGSGKNLAYQKRTKIWRYEDFKN